MNIGEANDVATVLQAITDHLDPNEVDRVAEAMHRLNRRAAAALQLTVIADSSELDTAAVDLMQRAADRQ